MPQTTDEMVQIRVTKEQREMLRMLKSSGESYSDALTLVIDSDPSEYSAIAKFAAQKV